MPQQQPRATTAKAEKGLLQTCCLAVDTRGSQTVKEGWHGPASGQLRKETEQALFLL